MPERNPSKSWLWTKKHMLNERNRLIVCPTPIRSSVTIPSWSKWAISYGLYSIYHIKWSIYGPYCMSFLKLQDYIDVGDRCWWPIWNRRFPHRKKINVIFRPPTFWKCHQHKAVINITETSFNSKSISTLAGKYFGSFFHFCSVMIFFILWWTNENTLVLRKSIKALHILWVHPG